LVQACVVYPLLCDILSTPDVHLVSGSIMCTFPLLLPFVAVPSVLTLVSISVRGFVRLRRHWNSCVAFLSVWFIILFFTCCCKAIFATIVVPQVILNPEWRPTDDGLDGFTRKIVKLHTMLFLTVMQMASACYIG